MTRLALYEQNEGREDMKISAYYKKDYVSMKMIATFIWTTVGYVCAMLPDPCLGHDRLDGEADAGPHLHAGGGGHPGVSGPPDHYIYHHQQDRQQETQRRENADEEI